MTARLRIPALIFARMDSSRLPGKTLMDLGGRSVLDRVVTRVRQCRSIDGVIVCTSGRAVDDAIAEAVAAMPDTGLFRGDAFDVLGRARAASDSLGADAAVRISGDSPLIDPELIERAVIQHRRAPCDLTTNVYPRTYPPGMSVEVIAAETLRRLDESPLDGDTREHVTRHIYQNADGYRIQNIARDTPCRDVSLALDTDLDFRLQSWLVAQLPENAGLDDIIAKARTYAGQMAEATS